MNEQIQMKINFNPDGIINPVSIQAGESLRMFAFIEGILARDKEEHVPEVHEIFPQWSVRLPPKSAIELKEELRLLLFEKSISDIITAIGFSLDEACKYLLLYNFVVPERTISSKEWNKFQTEMKNKLKGQHKNPLKNRLDWIKKEESINKILIPIRCHSERSEESRFHSPAV